MQRAERRVTYFLSWGVRSSLRRRAFVWPSEARTTHRRPPAKDQIIISPRLPRPPTAVIGLPEVGLSPNSMEITDLFFSRREQALLVGDYNSYRAQTSRRLHTVRKKLGQTTPKGRKYTAKPPVTAENVGSNVAYVCPESSHWMQFFY